MSDKEKPTADTVETVESDKEVKEVPAQKPAAAEKPVATEKPAATKTADKAADAAEKPAAAKAADKAPAEKPAAAAKPAAPAAEKPAAAKPAAPAAAKKAAAPVESKSAPDPFQMRRRIIWTSIVAFVGTTLLGFVRFFLPRAIFEPSTVFHIGYPSDYGIGVDTKFQNQYRIWVVRNAERLFVIYARCTHLGCTPDWKPGENKFKCPCHGSGYDTEGINFEGPAPRPMDRAKVELDPEGQIVVDTSKLYSWPKGAPTEFNNTGAYLQV
jgi:cytochrome b6-f complex iron-sulfur subunit